MSQTLICQLLRCPIADCLYVLSDRPVVPTQHFNYAGRRIEATEIPLGDLPVLPEAQLQALRELAVTAKPTLTLELVDEFSGGDPVPVQRPYFPWD